MTQKLEVILNKSLETGKPCVTVWELEQFNSPGSSRGRDPLQGQTPTGSLELCAIRDGELSSNTFETQSMYTHTCMHTHTHCFPCGIVLQCMSTLGNYLKVGNHALFMVHVCTSAR